MIVLANFLALVILVPIFAGIICLLIPARFRLVHKSIALVITLVSVLASIRIYMTKPLYWPPVPNPMFIADNLSFLAALGISFFALVVTVYSFGFFENGRELKKYLAYALMSLGSALGAVFANDLIIMTVFWGALGALLYLLINIYQGKGPSNAAKKALVMIGASDAILVLGLAFIWKLSGSCFIDRIHIPLNTPFSYVAFFCVAVATFAKAGAFPLHSWLPDVVEQAPAPVSAYLPASLDKLLGIYLLARISLDLFVMNNISGTFLLIIGSITLVFAVGMALIQHDIKRLLGYHAVSQVGYMVIGIGTLNPIGIAGALFHMLNNAIYKSCLFLGSGAVEKECRTSDLSRLGGLAPFMPLTFAAFLISALAISGIPPFNGFVSKWMIYQGIIEMGKSGRSLSWTIWLLAAMFGSALTVASFIKLLYAIFLGKRAEEGTPVKETSALMLWPMLILSAVCVLFGVFAFAVPLTLLIAPAVGEGLKVIGIWNAPMAAYLLLAGIGAGIAAYFIILPRKARKVSAFVGGEDVSMFDRITGTEFYDTIKDLRLIGSIYKKEESGRLDLYGVFRNLLAGAAIMLKRLHNGVMPTYITWCLIGMAAMFVYLFFR